MMELTKEQQEEFNRILGQRLTEERNKLDGAYNTLKTEYETLKTKLAEWEPIVTKELPELKRDKLINEVVAEVGLPVRFTSRIKGDTKVDMLADANVLKADLEATNPTILPRTPANTEPVPKPDAMGRLVDHAVNYKKVK